MKHALALALFIGLSMPGPAAAQTQAETCDAIENIALSVLRAKVAGSSEIRLRQNIDAPKDGLIDKMITLAYSNDRVTDEFMLAMARMHCSLLFFGVKSDGSMVSPSASVDPSLPAPEWLEACTKAEWFDFHRKLKGEGTMINIWEKHKTEVNAVTQMLWEKKDAINSGAYGPENLIEDVKVRHMSEFQDSISGKAMTCVSERIRLEAN